MSKFSYVRERPKDRNVEEIIKEIVQEQGISEDKVRNALSHFFNWQRFSFSQAEYASYLWKNACTFTYFNRSVGNRYEEADEYRDRKRLKDYHRRSLPKEAPSKEIEQLADAIYALPVEAYEYIRTKKKWRDVGYKSANVKTEQYWHYGWNKRSMYKRTAEELNEILSFLQSKINSNTEQNGL